MRTFDITPDGKRIVFDRLRENSNILLIDLAMNEPRPLQRYFFAGFLLKGQSRAWRCPSKPIASLESCSRLSRPIPVSIEAQKA